MALQTELIAELHGAKELDKLLSELGPAVAKKVVNAALSKAAEPVLAELRATAPINGIVADNIKRGKFYGQLRRNIRKGKRNATTGLILAIGIGRAFWGKFQEFGWKQGKQHPHQIPARPWFRPAWDRTKAQALRVLGEELGKGVEREALKLAGQLGTNKQGAARARAARAAVRAASKLVSFRVARR
jgi:HK97 gp10 family phage protein